MSLTQTLLLGAISGLTIFLGLPIARVRTTVRTHLAFLNAVAIGVLFFLFADIAEHATEPIGAALKSASPDAAMLLGLLVTGFAAGVLSLVYYGQRMLRTGGGTTPTRLALLIATGIGLHNFSEGLAIGNAGQSGEMSFAFVNSEDQVSQNPG